MAQAGVGRRPNRPAPSGRRADSKGRARSRPRSRTPATGSATEQQAATSASVSLATATAETAELHLFLWRGHAPQARSLTSLARLTETWPPRSAPAMPERRWGTCIMAIMRLSARATTPCAPPNRAPPRPRPISLPVRSWRLSFNPQAAQAQGLVRSQRGPDGGSRLARPAAEISLADIIRAIDGQYCAGRRPRTSPYPGAAEPLQQVWIALRANERAVLEQVALSDIVSRNLRHGPASHGERLVLERGRSSTDSAAKDSALQD